MNERNVIAAGAAALLLALPAFAQQPQMVHKRDANGAKVPRPGDVKCYGIVKAGQNDCANSAHTCAGQGVGDFNRAEFTYESAAWCPKRGGSTTPGK